MALLFRGLSVLWELPLYEAYLGHMHESWYPLAVKQVGSLQENGFCFLEFYLK